jgi:hypothetical protein
MVQNLKGPVEKEFETKSFKFVGVHLDETLNWEYHINHVNNKLLSAIYAINQVKKSSLVLH